jgi:hypothetical protein
MAKGSAARAKLFDACVVLLVGGLTAAHLHRLYTRGGPYFQRPATVVDHVGPTKHETRDALLALPEIARILPRDANVTVFRPQDGHEQFDAPNYLTAVALMPKQFVLPPFTAGLLVPRNQLIEYVVAIDGPFTHPAYKPVAGFPNAVLYQVQR